MILTEFTDKIILSISDLYQKLRLPLHSVA